MGGDFLEFHDALALGPLVYAIKAGDGGALQMTGNRLVGRKHEFFDDAMRDIAFGARYAYHVARQIDLDIGLGHIEIDGAALGALTIQNERQFAHQLEAPGQAAVTLAHRGIPFEQAKDIGVGHSLDAADDAAHELLGNDVSLTIKLKQYRQHQAIFARALGTDIRGEFDGEHRDRAIGKIDARAAQLGLDVDRRVRLDVMAYIGNMDLQGEVAIR